MGRIVKSLILVVALCFTAPLFAQFDFASAGAVSAGLGGASVALSDAGSAMENVAGLSQQEDRWALIWLRQQPKVDGMNQMGLSLLSPLPYGGMGLGVVYYGDANYHEERISTGYALPLSEHVSLGVAFHYLHSGTSDPYYEPLDRFTISLGLRYAPTHRLTVGFRAYNPLSVISESDCAVRIPALFNLGVVYNLAYNLLAVVEVEKNAYYPASLRMGLQYRFFDNYMARIGMSSAPTIYTFGLGIQKAHLGVDAAVQVHYVLGLLPQLSLYYRF